MLISSVSLTTAGTRKQLDKLKEICLYNIIAHSYRVIHFHQRPETK